MDRVPCDLCNTYSKNPKSLKKHVYRYHRNNKGQTLDLQIHSAVKIQNPSSNDLLKQYLKETDNRYNFQDFEGYKRKMKTTENDEEEAGPSSGNIKSLHICHMCEEQFSTQEQRGEHIDKQHPLCIKCKDRFKTENDLKRHLERFHAPNLHSIKCLICGKEFFEFDELNTHQSEHFQCTHCNLRFLTKVELYDHRKVHGLPKSKRRKTDIVCDLCHMAFDNNSDLKSHLKLKHKHSCLQCRITFSSKTDLNNHMTIHSDKAFKPEYEQRDDNTRKRLITDESEETVDNDQSLVPLKHKLKPKDSRQVIANRKKLKTRKKAKVDYDSTSSIQLDSYETDSSVETIDEMPVPIVSKPKKRLRDLTESQDENANKRLNLDISEIPDDETLSLVLSDSNESNSSEMDEDSRSRDEFSPVETQADRTFSLPEEAVIKSSQLERCQHCFRRFVSKAKLNQHIEETHVDTESSSDSDESNGNSQSRKCRICGEKFTTKRDISYHRQLHKKGKQVKSKNTFEKCDYCDKRLPSHRLAKHILLVHPTCKVCFKTFKTKREMLTHQKDHPEDRFKPSDSSDVDSSDTDSDQDINQHDDEDKDFHENINCVTIERFAEVRELIMKNDFKTLVADKKLLKALSIIMKGVKKGFIPICSAQRLVLTNSQKRLLYRLAKNTSSHVVMKEKQDLSLLFEVLWDSVKQVSQTFLKYDT